jgi:hypothetical protein
MCLTPGFRRLPFTATVKESVWFPGRDDLGVNWSISAGLYFEIKIQLFGRAGLQFPRRLWIRSLSRSVESGVRIARTHQSCSRQGEACCPPLILAIEH